MHLLYEFMQFKTILTGLMKNSQLCIKGNISPLFIIFIIITFAIFAFAMINLSLLPTPEEKRREVEQQMDAVILAEEAQATGVTIEELKGQKKRALNKQEIVHDINQASLKGDIQKLEALLSKLTAPPQNSRALVSAVNGKNTEAFSLLLAAKFPCSNDTDAGSRAFSASISSENAEFLKLLTDNGCRYIEQKNQKSLGERIAKSSAPDKIFLLPQLNLIEKFGGKALQNAIKRKREKQALTMIELGANIHTKNILELSIRSNTPTVALALINKGVILGDEKSKDSRFSPLTETFKRGFIDVSTEILVRDPNYITRNAIEDSIYNISLSIRNQEIRRKSISLALKYGVKPKKLIDGGSHGLIKAIFYQDARIVEQLLKAGVNPNIPDSTNLALIVAKNLHSPRYKQLRKVYRSKQGSSIETENLIISLLEKHGAIDNFLKAVMRAKGIKTISNCSLEKRKKIDFDVPKNDLPEAAKYANKYSQCIIKTTETCVNQGFGYDDCMRSIPTCNSDDRTAFCCEDIIKKQYFAGRCSGLPVRETMQWLKIEFNH